MESDDFTRNYIIRYLSAHELVLPLNWDMYCSKTDWFQEISAWVAENGAMFTLVIYIVVLRKSRMWYVYQSRTWYVYQSVCDDNCVTKALNLCIHNRKSQITKLCSWLVCYSVS